MNTFRIRFAVIFICMALILPSCGTDSPTGPSGDSAKTLTSYKTDQGLPNNTIITLAVDPMGNVWCGTIAGLAYFDGASWHQVVSDKEQEIGQKLSVRALACSPDGDIWMNGMIENSLYGIQATYFMRFDGTEWTDFTENDAFSNKIVTSIAFDLNGALWIALMGGGTMEDGIFRFDGSEWKKFDLGISVYTSSISVSPTNDVWFATSGGLFRFDQTAWRQYTQKDGLPVNVLSSSAIDNDGNVWFGYNSNYYSGMSRFDGSTLKTYNTDDGLINNYVRTLAIDNDNNVWVGTEMGVSKFDGKKWTSLEVGDEPISRNVNAIAAGLDGSIWIGSSRGLYRYK